MVGCSKLKLNMYFISESSECHGERYSSRWLDSLQELWHLVIWRRQHSERSLVDSEGDTWHWPGDVPAPSSEHVSPGPGSVWIQNTPQWESHSQWLFNLLSLVTINKETCALTCDAILLHEPAKLLMYLHMPVKCHECCRLF